jgi:hypothetical protein
MRRHLHVLKSGAKIRYEKFIQQVWQNLVLAVDLSLTDIFHCNEETQGKKIWNFFARVTKTEIQFS